MVGVERPQQLPELGKELDLSAEIHPIGGRAVLTKIGGSHYVVEAVGANLLSQLQEQRVLRPHPLLPGLRAVRSHGEAVWAACLRTHAASSPKS